MLPSPPIPAGSDDPLSARLGGEEGETWICQRGLRLSRDSDEPLALIESYQVTLDLNGSEIFENTTGIKVAAGSAERLGEITERFASSQPWPEAGPLAHRRIPCPRRARPFPSPKSPWHRFAQSGRSKTAPNRPC